MSRPTGESYAGDVRPANAFSSLANEAKSALVDVRTKAEWAYVGVASLDSVGKTPIFVEWQGYASMAVDGQFVERLERKLEEAAIEPPDSLFFLCRSGVRSKSAAIAMTEAGWLRCFNVTGGFEGPCDSHGHRGVIEGWKANGLPWIQS